MKSEARMEDEEKGAIRLCEKARSSSEQCQDWMSLIPDDCPLSDLTIPGTHDSAAYTTSLPFIATQGMDILSQLNAGVRYFDLRCAIRDDTIEMVHGVRYLGLTLEEVLETMYAWLSEHPSEGLIAQIKRDRSPLRSTKPMFKGVLDLIAQTPSRWRTTNTTPLLEDLRGRIQLFRRFGDSSLSKYGIDVTNWPDNPSKPFTTITHGVQLTIQDHYNFSDPQSLPTLISNKGGDVSNLLRQASSDPDPMHWYMNFTSAFEFNLWYQISPRQIAVGGWYQFRWREGVNVRLRATLELLEGRRKRFGIVIMDFPELGVEDLVDALVRTNFESKRRRRRTSIFSVACGVLMFVFLLLCVALRTRAASQVEFGAAFSNLHEKILEQSLMTSRNG